MGKDSTDTGRVTAAVQDKLFELTLRSTTLPERGEATAGPTNYYLLRSTYYYYDSKHYLPILLLLLLRQQLLLTYYYHYY